MKKRLGPSEMLYPMPTPLIAGGSVEEPAIMAVAWIAVAGSTPSSVVMAVRKTRNTLEAIRRTGEFTVNIPVEGQEAQVDYCGLVSGRKEDKVATAGFTLSKGSQVGAPLIDQMPFNLECHVMGELDNGEYVLMMGEILETHCEESMLDESGSKPNLDKLKPLVYCPSVREYRGLGPKLADAFSVGKSLRAEGE